MRTLRDAVLQKIRRSRESSSVSESLITFLPEPSRWLPVGWLGVHALVVTALWWAELPAVLAGLCSLVAIVRCVALWPHSAPPLARAPDGRWALPSRGLKALTLGPGTRYTGLWVKLELVGGPVPVDVVLLADQLDPIAWSRLQAALRGGSRGRDLTALSSRSV